MANKTVDRHFRLTKEEYNTLCDNANRCGLTHSAYLRHLINGYKPKEKPDKEFYDVLRQLSSISNNLNQLTAKANSLGFIDIPLLKKMSDEISNLTEEILLKFINPDKE